MKNPKYVIRLKQVAELSHEERDELQAVTDKFVFRSNDYYQELINWEDPDDPIRQLIMPNLRELDDWGKLDASGEESFTKVPGLEHKYPSTALLLCSDVCAGYCRYCFRKRLFMTENEEVVKDVRPGVEYIRQHPEITNVLLTGGDPLILATVRLEEIFEQLYAIPHVRIVRIGSKLPAFNPYRILKDSKLTDLLGRYRTMGRQVYIMAHFDHPRELTEVAVEGLRAMLDAGAKVVNQNPIIRGVNDSVDTLRELWDRLSYNGIPPYYIFQCRPTLGNAPYTTPIEHNLALVEAARQKSSGLAKRVRFVMSHATGKIEVVAMTEKLIIFRYHSAAHPGDEGRVMIFERNPEAAWLEDYTELVNTHVVTNEAAAELAA
ncbi:MAG: KamA family radical SAM protein [Calditrichaeota bacterium]|nr:KamA family radical SAM protein [Calditrichota bacterium]MCB9367367.1 KamA family radical SAM protein [Calditrichota bacterium]MCB9391333.1 KamA family radical SAM protein [Calditrichota bacterium]